LVGQSDAFTHNYWVLSPYVLLGHFFTHVDVKLSPNVWIGDCGHVEVHNLVIRFPYPTGHTKTHLPLVLYPKYPYTMLHYLTHVRVIGSAYTSVSVHDNTHFLLPSFISSPK
jgi:hypothetical protein